MGWLPSAPQLETNPLRDRREAAAGRAGAQGLCRCGAEVRRPARCPARTPTIRPTGRATCSSGAPTCWVRRGKGHEYFLKHLLGTIPRRSWARTWARRADEKPKEVAWHDEAPEGKLDLLVTLDFRMSTTCVYSDIVLPTATWYEKNDLNTSDMHPFIHPLTAAVDPAWEGAQRLGDLQGDRQDVLGGRAGSAGRGEGRRADADPARHAGRDGPGRSTSRTGNAARSSRSRARRCRRSRWSSATIPTSTSASPRSAR